MIVDQHGKPIRTNVPDIFSDKLMSLWMHDAARVMANSLKRDAEFSGAQRVLSLRESCGVKR